MRPGPNKPIIWIGSSLKDLRNLPTFVKREIGHALHLVELGERSHKAKTLKGLSGVVEISINYATNAYRGIYTVQIDDNIYVLHVFQKKSKRGISTTKQDIGIINKRLKVAIRLSEENKI